MVFNPNQHRNILLKILKDIYSSKDLATILGFKGGTAAYLFYDLNRFSVDLDFDLLKPGQENEVFGKIKQIVSQYGEIKDEANKLNTLFVLLSYETGCYKVKIEVNKRSFNSDYKLKNYLGIPMLVMTKADMLAHKLVALLDRKKIAGRDIFDINFFLKKDWPINEEVVKLRTGKPLAKYLKEVIKFLPSVSKKTILSGLGELIDEKQKVWVKENLLKDTLFLLKLRLKDLEE